MANGKTVLIELFYFMKISRSTYNTFLDDLENLKSSCETVSNMSKGLVQNKEIDLVVLQTTLNIIENLYNKIDYQNDWLFLEKEFSISKIETLLSCRIKEIRKLQFYQMVIIEGSIIDLIDHITGRLTFILDAGKIKIQD